MSGGLGMMTSSKAVASMVLFLVFILEKRGYCWSPPLAGLNKQEMMKPSHLHRRERRDDSANFTEYEFQLAIGISDLDLIQDFLNSLRFPLPINSAIEVTGVNASTVCSSEPTGYQCKCKPNFALPPSSCDTHGSCDVIAGDPCKCINALPDGGPLCQDKCSLIDEKEEKRLSVTLDLDFDASFGNPSSEVYQRVNASIQEQCRRFILCLQKVQITQVGRGSTIFMYTVTAILIEEQEIVAAESGIVSNLAATYPVLVDSQKNLTSEQQEVFLGKEIILTCGPPPEELNFGSDWSAEWRRDDELVNEDDLHIFSRINGKAALTITKFYFSDQGRYVCKLRGNNQALKVVFREQSSAIAAIMSPVITVSPVTIQVACTAGRSVTLLCSVNRPYKVEFRDIPEAGVDESISHTFTVSNCADRQKTFRCQEKNFTEFYKEITLGLLDFDTERVLCANDPVFGDGNLGNEAVGPCESDKVGEMIAICKESGLWEVRVDNCVLRAIQELLDQSQTLNNLSLPKFLGRLSEVAVNLTDPLSESPSSINAIVEILSSLGNLANITIIPSSIKDILLTTGVLTLQQMKSSWDFLNGNDTRNTFGAGRNLLAGASSTSSGLLLAMEILTRRFENSSYDVDTPHVHLSKTTFTDTFSGDFESSVEVDIPEANGGKKLLTVITFDSMDNVLPPRDEENSTFYTINGRIVLVQSTGIVTNVSFTFDILNQSLRSPLCVFWNFSLFRGLGGWDDEGCELVFNENQTVSCFCNHLTSFSILMSPYGIDDPVLDFITYIGVGLSMASLLVCLIIEAYIWRRIKKNRTAYLRHVSIINIALSLLIANIWFIVGAAISDANEQNTPACSAATFFIHFFYLALFFWMLAAALLLLYRTLSVFGDGLSKRSMLAIGFCLGYGAPLIISVVTVAVTAPQKTYIRDPGICWLNWDQSRALLAFVVPALSIVGINLIIMAVVLYKVLRRRSMGSTERVDEKNAAVVIARALAVLTPFFGLTWGLGIGTMLSPFDRGIHISFAFFNSLQGFFILVFGTLLDRTVREQLSMTSQSSGRGTGTTSAGSSRGLGIFRNWRRGRDGYNASTSASQSNT